MSSHLLSGKAEVPRLSTEVYPVEHSGVLHDLSILLRFTSGLVDHPSAAGGDLDKPFSGECPSWIPQPVAILLGLDMLLWKALAAVAASASGIIAALIGKGKATRGARHPKTFWIFIAFSLVGVVASIALAVAENTEFRRASQTNEALLAEIHDLGDELAPFVEAATALYPNAEADEALRLLTTRIDSLEDRTGTLESQSHFQPLDPAIRTQVVGQLRAALSDAVARGVSVHVVCEGGSNPRLQIGAELVEVLTEAGYAATGPSTKTSFYSGAMPSVVIEYSPSCQDPANMLYRVLRPVLRTEFSGRKPDTEPDGCRLILEINGDPLFGADGTVEFR